MKNLIKSDEQSLTHQDYTAINWVGMSKIQSCIQDQDRVVPMELDIQVDLRSGQRGIHMSRLYALQMNELMGKTLDQARLQTVIKEAVGSQEDASQQARLKMRYQSLLKTRSLKSETAGFRSYPVELSVEGDRQGLKKVITKFVLLYSSTCPQSAKLSKESFKEIISDHESLQQWYSSNEIYPATPHAQRSEMVVELRTNEIINVAEWIQKIESRLKTNVQTAVKKADEMEFARLNAENPMFCEDAVRTVAGFLSDFPEIKGFRLMAEHLESLHPHNAYSQITQNF